MGLGIVQPLRRTARTVSSRGSLRCHEEGFLADWIGAVSCFGAIAVGGYTAAKAVDKAGATVNAAHQVEDAIAATTEKAYIATMKSDLRNLVTAQEAYFSDNAGTYAASTTALGTTYQPASSVTVTLSNVTTTGWTATASHTSTAKTCSISMGGTSTNEGEPVCK